MRAAEDSDSDLDEFVDTRPCSVCREHHSIEGNEVIFCGKCNVAVHQKCYEINERPYGQWCVDPLSWSFPFPLLGITLVLTSLPPLPK